MNFQYLGMDYAHFIIFVFIYSFLGWCMECVVIRKELGRWENRGFSFAPFCIIYGLGTVMVSSVFQPIKDDYFVLMVLGALFATSIEFMTAMIMLRLFGKIWWDYSHLKYNFRGILSLESTIAWGCIAVFVISFWNDIMINVIERIPSRVAFGVSVFLIVEYILDFSIHFYVAISDRLDISEEKIEEILEIDEEITEK